MAQILLHGTLHVTIYEADRLKKHSGNIFRKLKEKFKEPVGFGKGVTKLYATIDLEKARVGRTRILENEHSNPKWYESFHIYCAHMASNVVFTVKENNTVGATLIGKAYVPVEEILDGEVIKRKVEILDEHKNPIHGDPRIHVKLQFFDVTKELNWARGIRSPKFPGVPHTFYSQRQGCKIFLYQDAHVPDKFVPNIPLAGGQKYEPHRCWEDVFDAITNAKHLIYITAWSFSTEITLVRDSRRPRPGGGITLGELLKKKASEGVRVLMLVWDDQTSDGLFIKEGLMTTHDKKTQNYFKNTNVHCVLCPRKPDDGGCFVQGLQIAIMFTHHQKIVLVDSELPSGGSYKRRIVSFIGGFDLCDGRYDTPLHSLFRTLDREHFDDFRQPCFPDTAINKGGPREPWHEIHCRLEGLIAWDVLFNFEQRWRKQGGKDLLLQLRELQDFILPPSQDMFPVDCETWNVQLFRSIDGGAAYGFPQTPEDAAIVGLFSGKHNIIDRGIQDAHIHVTDSYIQVADVHVINRGIQDAYIHVIDRGIQDAYIHAIRRAKNFIYIENQYFLGSSFAWSADDIRPEDINASHLIPRELSLKIVSKIEAGERFAVYVVIPMWPGRIPENAPVQSMLDWQRRTMEMMYKDVIQALKVKGLEEDPRNYLTFFCLGNRELKKHGEYEPPEKPDPDTNYMRAQESRRFMIYVHAKMMIVDDEYIIVGSANINQRSMDGARDTEIAMGAYQPNHLAHEQPALGQIHGLRMSLWYEHLGVLEDSFLRPESEECLRRVNHIADKNWDLYSSESLEHDLPGHLLRYPIGISSEGEITELPGFEHFPDTKARVLGSKKNLPTVLTV